jgi:anti-sigma B factor antagonist
MIQLETSPTTTTITVVGDLDLAERDQFPEMAARVSGLRRQLLVVDMCRTTFLDSTGAAFLISLADVLGRRGGVTVLRGAAARDLFVLEVCGALEMFRLDNDHRCPEADKTGPWRVRPRGADE